METLNAVPVTAYTSITGCGIGNKMLYDALLENQTALTELTLFDIPFATVVAQVDMPLPDIREELRQFNSRNARMALAALNHPEDGVRAAVEQAVSCYGKRRIGVVIGTSTSGLYETEHAYKTLVKEGYMPDDFHYLTRHAYQATTRFLQQELALQGPCFTVSTACSSGAKAIAAGQRLINHGVCDAVLVGGVDTLCRLTLRGFHSLELISEDYCRPMDHQRHGINIGEGAGLLLLEKPNAQHADCIHVLSVGESSDAHHMSSPHPDGLGASLAIRNALQLAGIKAPDVDYLNLHATATRINDRVEAKAISEVFGTAIPCSGSKGIFGHTLGAAGAIEAIVSLLALQQQFIPGTCGLQKLDQDCRCKVIKEPLPKQTLHTVMSNSFGFGGNNASIIFSLLI